MTRFHAKASFPFTIAPQDEDEAWMLEAIREAWKAYEVGEVPVGAVLVHEGQVLARGHNQVELLKDATAHAEMLCLTAGEDAFGDWRLQGTTLYCTLEPCAMCAGAMLLTRIETLVWGAQDLRHGVDGSWMRLFDEKHPTHTLKIKKGVLAEPCAFLMRQFFKSHVRCT